MSYEPVPSIDLEKDTAPLPRKVLPRRNVLAQIVVLALTFIIFLSTYSILFNSDRWNRYAYVQYVTGIDHLCNSLMLFERLDRFQSKPDRVMLYPRRWRLNEAKWSEESRLLNKAQREYRVILSPVDIISKDDVADATWSAGYTKLLAFNLTQYDRVLLLDSDSAVLDKMDELFLLPKAAAAMPRAYWIDGPSPPLSAQLLLATPSVEAFQKILSTVSHAKADEYDMEVINQVYGSEALVLPHRPYNILSGEFRRSNHTPYWGESSDGWDARTALKEAKFLHFSDWPVPKPWYIASEETVEQFQPACQSSGEDRCAEREIWRELYSDFAFRRNVGLLPFQSQVNAHRIGRQSVCGMDLNPDMYWRSS